MIKAVFFDLYHTLVRFEPPREELQARTLKDFDIEVRPEVFHRPLIMADEFIYQEMARCPLSRRSEENKMALWVQYQEIVLREAGIEADEQLVLGVLGKMQQFKMGMVLFDDVVSSLAYLRGKGLILGMISNVGHDITSLLEEVGLISLLQVVVTSQEAGFSKPQPEIFQAALRRAGVQAAEAIFVGDQYRIDVVGANQAGMKGILLDRGGYYKEVTDCPRIQGLSQVADYL